MEKNKEEVVILVFDEVDPLDVFGPFEVFSLAQLNVTIASFEKSVILPQGVKLPSIILSAEDNYELFVIPGGKGILSILKDKDKLELLFKIARNANKIASICAGSLILAALGLLNGKKATTHWQSKELLKMFHEVEVKNDRVVAQGNIYTSSGITSGIDLALKFIEDYKGVQKRKEVELIMEYRMRSSSFEEDFSSNEYQNNKVDVVKQLEQVFNNRHEAIQKILDKD